MMMNLTTDPWIPVVWEGGRPGLVSLTEAFQRGEEIQDLAVRPHERIALMRLLICVAQAALDGPKDHLDWQTCRERIAPSAADYLKKWRMAFELFGDSQRFLQVANLKPAGKAVGDEDEGNSVSKLDLALATGNNTTLFDNGGGTDRTFTPAQLALMLLTFQCFSPSGIIGAATWGGTHIPKQTGKHSPCIAGSMLHSLIRGTRLLETIHRNLLSKETVSLLVNKDGWGRPSWEQMPASAQDAPAVQNTTATYLGRLIPVARAIRLETDGLSAVLGNGLKYPPYEEWREPTATIVVRQRSGKPERVVLGASLDRAPWRELHALAVRRVSRDTNGGPVALQNIAENESFDLWVGGLVADKAKLLDVVEAVFHVPAGMLTEPCQRIYEDGVKYASDLEFRRLQRAVSTYHKELGNNLDRPELREQRKRVQSKATFQFWTDIERDVQQLLDVVGNAEAWPAKDGWSQTVWGKTVWTAAIRAFDSACPHDTARQMRAFALAQQVLFSIPQPGNSTDRPEETES